MKASQYLLSKVNQNKPCDMGHLSSNSSKDSVITRPVAYQCCRRAVLNKWRSLLAPQLTLILCTLRGGGPSPFLYTPTLLGCNISHGEENEVFNTRRVFGRILVTEYFTDVGRIFAKFFFQFSAGMKESVNWVFYKMVKLKVTCSFFSF